VAVVAHRHGHREGDDRVARGPQRAFLRPEAKAVAGEARTGRGPADTRIRRSPRSRVASVRETSGTSAAGAPAAALAADGGEPPGPPGAGGRRRTPPRSPPPRPARGRSPRPVASSMVVEARFERRVLDRHRSWRRRSHPNTSRKSRGSRRSPRTRPPARARPRGARRARAPAPPSGRAPELGEDDQQRDGNQPVRLALGLAGSSRRTQHELERRQDQEVREPAVVGRRRK